MVLRPGDSEETFSVFESSWHLLLPPVKPFKGRGNPVKCFAQGHNKRSCRLNLLTSSRKLWIPTF